MFPMQRVLLRNSLSGFLRLFTLISMSLRLFLCPFICTLMLFLTHKDLELSLVFPHEILKAPLFLRRKRIFRTITEHRRIFCLFLFLSSSILLSYTVEGCAVRYLCFLDVSSLAALQSLTFTLHSFCS